MALDMQCREVAGEPGSASLPQQLYPAWHNQWLRLLVPCNDGKLPYEWRRIGSCTSLGLLFLALGNEYSTAQIYEYYLCLKIVSLKRRKGKSSIFRASGKRGSSAAGLAGSQIRKK